MLIPTMLIYERRPRWVPELERQFLGEECRIRGCRTLRDVSQRLIAAPRSLVLLELEAGPAECLQTLGRWMAWTPSPIILVVATPALRELEWPVRELNATAFLEEPIPGDELAALCRRQFC